MNVGGHRTMFHSVTLIAAITRIGTQVKSSRYRNSGVRIVKARMVWRCFHRQTRSKRTLRSELDDIPGIGPIKRRKLLSRFGSLRGVRGASIEELATAVGRMTAFGTGPLLMCTFGLVVLGLLRSPLRWSGAIAVVAAALWAVRVPVPDVLVADRGDVVAVRGQMGRLSIMRTAAGDAFSVREWLAADADARAPKDKSLSEGVTCDEIGCVARLADRSVVASVGCTASSLGGSVKISQP